MGFSGDFAGLKRLEQQLMRTAGVPQLAARRVAPVLADKVRETFDLQQTPEGRPWQELKARTFARGSKAILFRSGALMAAVGFAAVSTKVKLMLGMNYVKYHLAKRSPFPKSSGNLPPSWNDAVKTEVDQAFEEILKG